MIASLGILSAIGSYYVPRLLGALEEGLDTRPPLLVSSPGYRTETPNFAFPAEIQPGDIPNDLFVRAANNHEQLQIWAQEHGGMALGEQEVDLVLRGRSSEPVVVSDVAVRVVDRSEVRRVWYNTWEGCGGLASVRTLSANVSADEVVERWESEGKTLDDSPILRVTSSDIEVLRVKVIAPHGPPELIEWVVDIAYTMDGASRTLEIADGDTPFEIISAPTIEGADAYRYEPSNAGLVPMGRSDVSGPRVC